MVLAATCNVTDRLTRALCPAPKPGVEGHVFWVGTCSPEQNRLVCVRYLEGKEGKDVKQLAVVEHPEEVWSITAAPGGGLLMVAASAPGDRSQQECGLWNAEKGAKEAAIPCSRIQHLSFDNHSGLQHGGVVDSESLRRVDWSASARVVATIPVGPRCAGGALDPHAAEQAATCDDCALRLWDLRAPSTPAAMQPNAHEFAATTVSYAPALQYRIVTGGEDAKVRVWDSRKLDKHLQVCQGHTHWVVNATCGLAKDLVLSSGTDAVVCLWRCSATSESSELSGSLVTCYQDHEDSVYGCCWSAEDQWVFASLSYDGRLLVHSVSDADDAEA